MKKISLLFLISFIYISCSKTSDQEYMNQANDFIKEKKIIEALKCLGNLDVPDYLLLDSYYETL